MFHLFYTKRDWATAYLQIVMFLITILNLSLQTKCCHKEDVFFCCCHLLTVLQILLCFFCVMTTWNNFREMIIIFDAEKISFQARFKFQKTDYTWLMSVKVFATYVSSFRIPRKWRNVSTVPRAGESYRCDGRKTAVLQAEVFPFQLMPLSSWRPLLLI